MRLSTCVRRPGAVLATALALAASPAAAQVASEAPVVTLEEARRRAAAVDPAAVAAEAEVSAAVWERRAARAGLFTPSLTAATSYVRFSEPFFNFGTAAISSDATSATVEASYTILGGGKLGELRRSNASLRTAEANRIATAFRIALAADAAYYDVLAGAELRRVAADRLKRAEEQLGVARVRVQAGQSIATDSLQLVLELNRSRLDVLRRDSALSVARLRLGRTIGLSGPAEAAPLEARPPAPLPLSLEEAVAELRTSGPELRAARAAERGAAAALSAERERYLPAVVLNATAGAYDSEFFPSATRRGQIALMVSWPIWDGGQREAALARARASRDVTRARREERERAAAEVMAQAYSGYRTARAAIELARAGVGVAAESYRVQAARYREGASTILDLLEAQVALAEAEAELVQARYAARLSRARIEALLGRRLPRTDR